MKILVIVFVLSSSVANATWMFGSKESLVDLLQWAMDAGYHCAENRKTRDECHADLRRWTK